MPSITGTASVLDPTPAVREARDDAPFAALVFKVTTDLFVGQLSFFRVYSGVLRTGDTVLNSTRSVRSRVGRLLKIHANKREEIKEVYAGDIAAVVGLRNARTGETICTPAAPVVLEAMEFPEPVISRVIEPATRADQEKLAGALGKLTHEDPTFRVRTDAETAQTLISGMGELHLEIIVDRLLREFQVGAVVGQPRVAYRETIRTTTKSEGRYVRQTGGRGQYGHVRIEVFPNPVEPFEFINDIAHGAVPREFIPAVEEGARDALAAGPLAGYPVTGVTVRLYHGTFHSVDSSELAFRIAGSMAVKDALRRCSPVILEPVMKVEVVTPDNFTGEVMGDLNSRRARISGLSMRGNAQVVAAQVPLAGCLATPRTFVPPPRGGRHTRCTSDPTRKLRRASWRRSWRAPDGAGWGRLKRTMQPVERVTRHSTGDSSRLNRPPTGRTGATRPSSLRFGRNTPGIPPSRALSARRFAALGAHATLSTGY